MKKPITPIANEAELYERALKLLTQKSRSTHDLRRLLTKRCEKPTLVEMVIDKCIARGYLDDVKYAVQFARLHVERRRHGRRRIVLELRTRGVSAEDIETAVGEVFCTLDEETLVRRALENKLKIAAREWTAPKARKLYAQLIRAGFRGDLIVRELRRSRIEALKELGKSVAPDE